MLGVPTIAKVTVLIEKGWVSVVSASDGKKLLIYRVDGQGFANLEDLFCGMILQVRSLWLM